MEINALPRIKVKDLLSLRGLSLSSLKRFGAQLAPNHIDWYRVNRSTWLSLDIAFLIHLVDRILSYNMLLEDKVILALGFFRERISKYVLELTQCIENEQRLPINSFEVLENRWVRVGEPDVLFDLDNVEPVTPLELDGVYNFSSSLCLLPIFLELNSVRTNVNNRTQREIKEISAK